MIYSTLLPLIAIAGSVSAHTGCGGQEIARRNPGGRIVEKRQVTDEASAAASTDPSYECTAYSYAPVTNIKANYPTIWETATIQSSDTTAQALFQTINSSLNAQFPNDLPRGTFDGDFTGVSYNSTDPDCWWTWRGCDTPAASTGLPADITTVPEPMTWGLGFDDGPNCSHNALYDYLSDNNQKATMFFIGSNVMDWPLQAIRAVDDGHEVCVHTWSHQYMTSFSNEDAFAELYYTRQAIKDLLGVTPKCWRPPYGDVDNRIRFIAQSLNLTTIVWSDDTEDWKEGVPADNVTEADVAANYQTVINGAKNGTYSTHGPVVLNHELTNFTMSEFVAQYPSIKSAFTYVVPLCTALNITHPYEETNITCPDFATYIAGTTNTSATTTESDGTTSASASAASGSASGASGSASASSASGSSGTQDAAASASSSHSAGERLSVTGVRGLGAMFVAVVLGLVGGAYLV